MAFIGRPALQVKPACSVAPPIPPINTGSGFVQKSAPAILGAVCGRFGQSVFVPVAARFGPLIPLIHLNTARNNASTTAERGPSPNRLTVKPAAFCSNQSIVPGAMARLSGSGFVRSNAPGTGRASIGLQKLVSSAASPLRFTKGGRRK